MPRDGKTSLTVDEDTAEVIRKRRDEAGTTLDKLLLRWAAGDTVDPEGLAEMVASALENELTLREGVDAEAIAQRVAASVGEPTTDLAAIESAARRGAATALQEVAR